MQSSVTITSHRLAKYKSKIITGFHNISIHELEKSCVYECLECPYQKENLLKNNQFVPSAKNHIYFGGEPLLKTDLIGEINQYPYARHWIVNYNCILSNTNPTIWKKSNVRIIHYLASMNKDSHNDLTGSASYDKIIENLIELNKQAKKTVLIFALTRTNVHELSDLHDFAKKFHAYIWLIPQHHSFGVSGFEDQSINYIKYAAKQENFGILYSDIKKIPQNNKYNKFQSCKYIPNPVSNSIFLTTANYWRITKFINKINNKLVFNLTSI